MGLTKGLLFKSYCSKQKISKIHAIQRQTSGGKSFLKKSCNSKKYNIVYVSLSGTWAPDGRSGTYESMEAIEDSKCYLGKALKKVDKKILKEIFISGKKIIAIAINDDFLKGKFPKDKIYEAAIILNHEEVAHANDSLDGNKKNGDEDYKEYYGKKCGACKDGLSPNEADVVKKKKYRNSVAKKQYHEIRQIQIEKEESSS